MSPTKVNDVSWIADVWAAIAGFLGFDEQSWGTVAEWFAAIGTVGALLLGLLILRNERRLAHRKDADALVTWARHVHAHLPNGDHSAFIQVNAHNTGDRPVIDAILMIKDTNVSSKFDRRAIKGLSLDSTVEPKQVVHYGIEPRMHGALPELYLDFIDANNVRWLRDVNHNKYVRNRKAARIRKNVTEYVS